MEGKFCRKGKNFSRIFRHKLHRFDKRRKKEQKDCCRAYILVYYEYKWPHKIEKMEEAHMEEQVAGGGGRGALGDDQGRHLE